MLLTARHNLHFVNKTICNGKSLCHEKNVLYLCIRFRYFIGNLQKLIFKGQSTSWLDFIREDGGAGGEEVQEGV